MRGWIVTDWVTEQRPVLDAGGVQVGTETVRYPNLYGASDPTLGFAVRIERPNRCLVKVVCKSLAALKPLQDAVKAGSVVWLGEEADAAAIAALYPKVRAWLTNQGYDAATFRHTDSFCGVD